MKIKFKNLGPIESGEIDFNDLKGINLIICCIVFLKL